MTTDIDKYILTTNDKNIIFDGKDEEIIILSNYLYNYFPTLANCMSSKKIKYSKQILRKLNSSTNDNKIIVDIETDGKTKIIQISYNIIDKNNNIILKRNLFLNDGDNDIDYYKKISIDYIKIYGIKPKKALEILFNDLKQCDCIIGHNIAYDFSKIIKYFEKYYSSEELTKIKNNIPEKKYCTMQRSRNIVKCKNKKGSIKSPKLSELCEYYEIDKDDSKCHDGLYDVELTYKCYIKLCNQIQQ